MKIFFMIFMLIGCQACGAEPDIDPELKLMLDHYLRFAPNSGKLDLLESMRYKSILYKGERGVCNIEKSKIAGKTYAETRTLVIDPEGENAPTVLTVYHELGHCLHDLPHSEGVHDIMNPQRAGDADYWTVDRIDQSLVAMFAGVEMP